MAAGAGRATWKQETLVVAPQDALRDAQNAPDAGPRDGALTHRRTGEVARILAARAVTVLEQGAPIERAFHEAVVWFLAGQDHADLEAQQEALRDDVAGRARHGDSAALDTDLTPWRTTQRQQARASTWQVIDETLQVLRNERNAVVG